MMMPMPTHAASSRVHDLPWHVIIRWLGPADQLALRVVCRATLDLYMNHGVPPRAGCGMMWSRFVRKACPHARAVSCVPRGLECVFALTCLQHLDVSNNWLTDAALPLSVWCKGGALSRLVRFDGPYNRFTHVTRDRLIRVGCAFDLTRQGYQETEVVLEFMFIDLSSVKEAPRTFIAHSSTLCGSLSKLRGCRVIDITDCTLFQDPWTVLESSCVEVLCMSRVRVIGAVQGTEVVHACAQRLRVLELGDRIDYAVVRSFARRRFPNLTRVHVEQTPQNESLVLLLATILADTVYACEFDARAQTGHVALWRAVQRGFERGSFV
jgi:hypothetical protein